jgi:hypothetical protein
VEKRALVEERTLSVIFREALSSGRLSLFFCLGFKDGTGSALNIMLYLFSLFSWKNRVHSGPGFSFCRPQNHF